MSGIIRKIRRFMSLKAQNNRDRMKPGHIEMTDEHLEMLEYVARFGSEGCSKEELFKHMEAYRAENEKNKYFSG
jgi:DNA-binding response OmpR family regulator